MKDIKLRYQIVIWTVTLEAVLLFVFAAVFVTFLKSSQNQQIEETLRLSAAQLNAVVDIRSGEYLVSIAETAEMRNLGVMAWILNPQEQVALTIGNAENYALPETLPESGQMENSLLAGTEPVRLLVSPLSEGSKTLGTLVLAIPLKSRQTLLREIYLGLAIAIPLVVLLSAVGGLFLAGRALQPVDSITRTAQQISAADLSQRITLDLPDDEVGRLSQTFNDMLDRLENAFLRERWFTSDVSHELRTPLSLMKTQLSLARSQSRDAGELLDMIEDLEGDVDRMTRLVEQMLTLARVEQRGLESIADVDLRSLLGEVADQFSDAAARKSVKLTLALSPQVNLDVNGDLESLRQVLMNLIENAIKYTPPEGQVSLAAKRVWDQIEVIVENSGEPIPPEHLPHIFERFYRVESSRSRDSGGAGLGLAISREIIRRHGGDIQVASDAESGTVFTLQLPAGDH